MKVQSYISIYLEALEGTNNPEAAIEIIRQVAIDNRQNLNEIKPIKPADQPLTPATPKQIETLKKFKKYKEGISKIEATQIIGELFEKLNNTIATKR